MKYQTLLASALLAGCSLIAISGNAIAQESGGEGREAAPEADERRYATVTVTGSRVIADGSNSPSPVTVVGTEELLQVLPGSSLADALNYLPAFAGSRGAGSNPSTTGRVSGGNGAANQLNLRNLGITRTLVLMDGLRIPPTLFNSAVDVDLVPQMLVERVDIVTGGVSAVYGSDAVSGVVNYVIDHEFEGLRASGSYGVSDYGDAAQTDLAIAFGHKLSDRVHLLGSYQYRDFEGVLFRSDRPWVGLAGVTGAGVQANPYILQSDVRQRNFPFGGVIANGVLAGQSFRSDGVLSPFVDGTPTGTAALQIGGDGGYYDSSLMAPLEGHQLFGRVNVDLSSDLRAFAQISGNLKKNTNYQDPPLFNNLVISSQNAFLDPAYQAALAGAGESTFQFRQLFDQAPRLSGETDSEQWVFSAGLEGGFSQFNWGAYYVRGSSAMDTIMANNVNNVRLAAALDAVVDPDTGNIVCYSALQNPAAFGGCVPLNVFGPSAASSAAIDYTLGDPEYSSLTKTDNLSAIISGPVFETWAGPVNAALSAEWRKISFEADSEAQPDDLVNCADIRLNCSPSASEYRLTLPSEPKKSQSVREAALEVDIPLIRDASFLHAFNVNGAVRYTDYDTSGAYTTWKVGADAALTENLRFRATRSKDIRAPNLYELFAEISLVPVNGTDLLTGTSPFIPSVNGGNPDLRAEKADTFTAGLVWNATPRLTMALDYYHIEVDDAIEGVNGGDFVFQAACYESGGSSPYCLLQERPGSFTDTSAANAWTRVYSQWFNIASVETYGADLEVSYRGELFDRPLNVRFLGTYQPRLRFTQPNVADREQAGAAFGPFGFAATPKERTLLTANYALTDKVSVDLMHRWRSALKIDGTEGNVWENNRMASFQTTSVNLAYDTEFGGSDVRLYFNINNVFDADPPPGMFSGNGNRTGLRDGFATSDDPRGRYFTVGFRLSR